MSNAFRKVVIPKYGDASVLEIVEATLPQPAAGEVQVVPIYAGFSGADINMRRGVYPSHGSSKFKTGDTVACLTKYDAQAQLVNLPEKHPIPVPEGSDLQQVTGLLLDWCTAYGMVHQVARVKKGQTVFIHGISGSVGYATMKLVQLLGATAYGTASERNHAAIREQGGIPFVYTDKNWIKAMKDTGGVDAVFDSIGFESFHESYDILNSHGIVVGFGANKYSLTDEAPVPATWPTVKFLLKGQIPWRGKRTAFFLISRDKPTIPVLRSILSFLLSILAFIKPGNNSCARRNHGEPHVNLMYIDDTQLHILL
ncbi:PKS-ER domain-containing protein [Fusarium sp. LHS14.1]|nr:PKS-ER domain-containing protein [Fusarium sp. LHS14.1]